MLYEYNKAVMSFEAQELKIYDSMIHVCTSFVYQAIWNWVENSPDEFARLQRQPCPELSGIYWVLLTDCTCQTGKSLGYRLQK